MNELVAAHEKASNRMINIEEKTEEEMLQLSKHYSSLAGTVNDSEDMHASKSIEHVIDKKGKPGDKPTS
jgi:low affinity Fe/Cu permease